MGSARCGTVLAVSAVVGAVVPVARVCARSALVWGGVSRGCTDHQRTYNTFNTFYTIYNGKLCIDI